MNDTRAAKIPLTKWDLLDDATRRSLDNTIFESPLECSGCGEELRTEGEFARHFDLALGPAYPNLGDCPVRKARDRVTHAVETLSRVEAEVRARTHRTQEEAEDHAGDDANSDTEMSLMAHLLLQDPELAAEAKKARDANRAAATREWTTGVGRGRTTHTEATS